MKKNKMIQATEEGIRKLETEKSYFQKNTTKKLVDDTLVEWEQTKKVDKEAEEILHQVEFDFIKQSLLHDLGTENG